MPWGLLLHSYKIPPPRNDLSHTIQLERTHTCLSPFPTPHLIVCFLLRSLTTPCISTFFLFTPSLNLKTSSPQEFRNVQSITVTPSCTLIEETFNTGRSQRLWWYIGMPNKNIPVRNYVDLTSGINLPLYTQSTNRAEVSTLHALWHLSTYTVLLSKSYKPTV